ncbi:FecCD family ABC transporter permease [Paenibacillus sacheonensis]|uniref:Iron chelate uptake ABC transporter family permease subunit n=1 Tax=Paenibacillus sacheonensis TaxID=742054 RepID=A0A7X5BZN0_9BACL|nr:iron ABC transporter permease [Paenibacillus sacheonensis]MBM7566702.1 iron complex transport system permease protein [Paenibacillus sacheonensis]NBC70681.1 iron chelate uptake ABC transporter family permease subunit [Paenibacillus sacheonensis]
MASETTRPYPFVLKLTAGLLFFVAMFFIAMVFGAAHTTVKDVWLALTTNRSGENLSILREIRLPREIAAIFVGAALAVSGSVMQGMTRNPLADPGLLGLTAGANAALAFTVAFAPSANYFWITVTCFIGAAVGSLLVLGVGSAKKGGFSPLRIVLAGSAISAFLYAIAEGIGLAFKVSKDVSMWTAGGMIGTSWSQLQIIIPFITVGILIALVMSRQLTILSLSEDVAVGLGQKTGLIKAVLFLVTVLLAGASVALVGNLTFLGLMIPHIVRAIVGTDYRFVVPMSAIAGASFMLIADTVARVINAPFETPIAAIVAVVGLPFFLVIMRRGGKAIK